MNYEVDKWYWFDDENCNPYVGIAKFEKLDGSLFTGSECYFTDGWGTIGFNYHSGKDLKGLATPSQIEQCLNAYAQNSGYVEGAKIRSFISKNINLLVQANNYYDSLSDEYWLGGACISACPIQPLNGA